MIQLLPFFHSKATTPPPSVPEVPPAERKSNEDVLQDALVHFDGPGAHPPASRVDPSVPQREPVSLFSLRSVVKFGWFVAAKSTEVLQDVVMHQVYGPKRPTWGIEMTVISSFMRNLSEHSELTNIVALRALMAIFGYVPTPSSALITSVTFPVRRRGLPGILKDLDEAEDGSRELHGEWVVGRHLWWKLQQRWKDVADQTGERVILYLHGGAYYVFSAATHRPITMQLSKACGVRVFSLNYRLSPETRFPGALHDSVLSYLRLTEDLKIPPENIVVAGDSAGGGLALAMMMYLRDEGFPLPGGAILMSPWVDLTMSCASWDTNREFDICPIPSSADHLNPVYCYLGWEALQKGLATHPYASPLFGKFDELPPMLVQCGEAEVLRDEGTLLAHKATRHGVEVVHEVYQDAVHVFQTFPFLPVTKAAFTSCSKFMKNLDNLRREALHSRSRSSENRAMASVDEEIGGDSAKMMFVDSVGDNETSVDPAVVARSDAEGSSRTSVDTDSDSEEALYSQSQKDGTTTDVPAPPPTPLPSPDSVPALPRSKSTAILYSLAHRDPTSLNERRHSRRATGHNWRFAVPSQPGSPVTLRPMSSSMTTSVATEPPKTPDEAGTDGYFAWPATANEVPATPAPALRKLKRTATTGVEEEVEQMCREWTTEGPANLSVWCRREP